MTVLISTIGDALSGVTTRTFAGHTVTQFRGYTALRLRARAARRGVTLRTSYTDDVGADGRIIDPFPSVYVVRPAAAAR